MPPLRERPADIEALTWHFVDELNARGARRIEAIEERVIEAMHHHDWPGNVRELQNVIQHAFAVGRGSVLRIDELTPELRGEPPPSPHRTQRSQEREHILEALRQTGGRKGEAAKLLGISRSTLWRRMREHRL